MLDLSAQFAAIIEKAVSAKVCPGLGVIAFDKDGHIGSAYAGTANDTQQQWDENTIQGKNACSLIVLSVANDVKLDIDSHEQLVKWLPEFELGKGVLGRKLVGWDESEGSGKRKMVTEPLKTGATLRMLLDHTAGMGYFFTEPLTAKSNFPADEGALPNMIEGEMRSLAVPPFQEPGTGWRYGAGADWAVAFAIRASGKGLRQLVKEKITDKLGLSPDEFGTHITPEMDKHFATIYANIAPETFVPTPIRIVRRWVNRSLYIQTQYPDTDGIPPEGKQVLGSAPFYASSKAFARLLQVYLNDGEGLLPPELFKVATADSLARRGLAIPKPVIETTSQQHSYDIDEYSEAADGSRDNLGWTMCQQVYERKPSKTGRSVGSLSWSGLANGHYVIDRKRGLGLLVNAQFLPFADAKIMAVRDELERALFA